MAALSLLGSVFLSSTANGIAIFMVFGAGLVAGLLGEIGHALSSHTLSHAATVAAWIVPFEALYQDALREITANTTGLTGFLLQLGPFGGANTGGPARAALGVRLPRGRRGGRRLGLLAQGPLTHHDCLRRLRANATRSLLDSERSRASCFIASRFSSRCRAR